MTNSNMQKMPIAHTMRCIGCRKKIPDTCTTGCPPLFYEGHVWFRADIYDCGESACKATRVFACREINRTFNALYRKLNSLDFTQFIK